MKNYFCYLFFFLSACKISDQVPSSFYYKEIQTSFFKIASWQKSGNQNKVYKIYIEGDGYAFNAHGYPSSNPTPKSYFLRQIAFNDPSENVIYLARPCQYVQDEKCTEKYWTTARFSPEVIESISEAVMQIVQQNEVILIGFSGGAQVAGLTAVFNPKLHIKKLITISGNLDHQSWTTQFKLKPLHESLSLTDYKEQFFKIPQIHYLGTSDKTVLPQITKSFIKNLAPVIEVKNAGHNNGFEGIYPQIWYQDIDKK